MFFHSQQKLTNALRKKNKLTARSLPALGRVEELGKMQKNRENWDGPLTAEASKICKTLQRASQVSKAKCKNASKHFQLYNPWTISFIPIREDVFGRRNAWVPWTVCWANPNRMLLLVDKKETKYLPFFRVLDGKSLLVWAEGPRRHPKGQIKRDQKPPFLSGPGAILSRNGVALCPTKPS